MANYPKKAIQFGISLGLSALFLYWAFHGIDWSALWHSMQAMSPVWILAILGTTLMTLLIRGWRWKIMMRSFAPQVTVWDATMALGVCYAANLIVPRSGEALRALSLNWSRGTPLGSIMGTVVIERILDMFWLITLVCLSIVFMQERLSAAFPWLARTTLISLAGFVGVMLFLAVVLYNRQWTLTLLHRLFARFSSGLARRITALFEGFFKGLSSIQSPAAYLELLLSSVLLNTFYISIIYQAFAAFSFTGQYQLSFADALVIMSISSIGMIAPTPGGTGTYHFFFSQALILLYGIATEPALACATAVHGLATLLYLLLGGPVLYLQRRAYQHRQTVSQTA